MPWGFKMTLPKIQPSSTVKTIIGFTLSGFLLFLTLKNSGLQLQDIPLKSHQYLLFVLAILSFVLATWLQSYRTKFLWQGDKIDFEKALTYPALIIGNFYNCILPGNLGEGVRAYYFSKKHQVTFTRSIAVVFAEKWIDAQIFVFLAIVLFVLKPAQNHYVLLAIGYTASFILLMAIVYYFMQNNRWAEQKLWLPFIKLNKATRILFKMYWHVTNQVKHLYESGTLLNFVLLSTTTFSLNVIQFRLLLMATGIDGLEGGFYSAFLVAVSMMIIAFIPSAPSNIGVLHYGVYSALLLSASQHHVVPDVWHLQRYALFSVYLHLSIFVPEVLLGIVYLVRERSVLFN